MLGRALPAATTLTHLVLPNQRMGAEGAASICAGLAEHNASLTYLDLRSNNLMDAGAVSGAGGVRWGWGGWSEVGGVGGEVGPRHV